MKRPTNWLRMEGVYHITRSVMKKKNGNQRALQQTMEKTPSKIQHWGWIF
jgi:hypothetical protein